MLRHKIARRRKALQWFVDEAADPVSVLFRKPPSTRLRRLMLAEELLYVDDRRWRPTDIGLFIVRQKERKREIPR